MGEKDIEAAKVLKEKIEEAYREFSGMSFEAKIAVNEACRIETSYGSPVQHGFENIIEALSVFLGEYK